MKTNNLEVAERLAKITGRSVEDFYEGKNEEQVKEEKLEVPESILEDENGVHTDEVRDRNGEKNDRGCEESLELEREALRWKAEVSINGVLINNSRQMTRKEYLSMKRSFKTVQDFIDSPLQLIMFRSENQMNPFFPRWYDDVLRYIISKR